jgi:hypothetical protein
MPSAMLAMVCYSMWTVHTSLHSHSLRREGVLTTRSDSEAIAEEAREFHADCADEWGMGQSTQQIQCLVRALTFCSAPLAVGVYVRPRLRLYA